MVVAGEWLETGDEIAVADVRSAVHDNQRRLVGALPEILHEQRDLSDVDQHQLTLSFDDAEDGAVGGC